MVGSVTLLLGACGHQQRPLRSRAGSAEARSYYYGDSSGLTVVTTAASIEQPVSQRFSVQGRGVADYIVLNVPAQSAAGPGADMPTGHPGPDTITSASATVRGGVGGGKWRFEGIAGPSFTGTVGGRPVTASALFRVSRESDYLSYAGTVRGAVELFDRNLTVGAFAGYGHDRVSPLESPPGQRELWPATHQRWNAGLTATQLLTPRLVLSGAFSASLQRGQLASPYRRAVVRTTLFAEVVPDARDRYTAFAGLSWYLGRDIALHYRQGFYADTWNVIALIPELTLAVDAHEGRLLSLHYRYYKQWPASFYKTIYSDIARYMSGDMRLGRIEAHTVGVDLRWIIIQPDRSLWSLTALLGYELSFLNYDQLGIQTVFAHVATIGLAGTY